MPFVPRLLRLTCWIGVAAVALSLSGSPPAFSTEENPDPLLELNRAFRAAYARSKKEALVRKGPVVLVESGHVVLLRDGKRQEGPITPQPYTVMKEIAHVPLAIYLLLWPGGELNEDRLAELHAFGARMTAGRKALASHLFEKGARERQEKIFADSERFLDSAVAKKKVETSELTAFARGMRPLLQANIAEAARAELDALDRQVRVWRGEMTLEEWKQLRVLILGSALLRKNNLATQYFVRLLGEAGEGPRIIYAEAIFDEPRALDLLARHLVDTHIGQSFFDDPRRMMRDLLGDAAAEYIKQMKFE